MDSLQIRYILASVIPFQTFVCAKDQLVSVDSENFAVVCNNQNSHQSGQHWCSFYKTAQGKLEFYDSMGMGLEFYGKEFVNFTNEHGPEVSFNVHQYQSNFSNVCGNHCIFFLVHRANGMTFKEIASMFSVTQLERNDKLVYDFVHKNFPLPLFSNCIKFGCKSCSHKLDHLSAVCIQKNKQCIRIENNLTHYECF